MQERPALNRQLDSTTFRNFYWLKEELVEFCRNNGLPTSGGKLEITERIAHFLDTGEILLLGANVKKKITTAPTIITENSLIEPNFVCSENHRAFFEEHIGMSFSFNVHFQKWLKSHTGKTYKEAITAYYKILEEKKKKKKNPIDKQFEYNTYIREFFEDNKGKCLEDAIKCWKYKKQLQGHNRYEKSDLIALE